MVLKEYYGLPDDYKLTMVNRPNYWNDLPKEIQLPKSCENLFNNGDFYIIGYKNTTGVTNMRYMFQNCTRLTYFMGSDWDVSNVRDMSNMFESCHSLKYIDFSNWDTSSVTNMGSLFTMCYAIKKIDLGALNMSNVESIQRMFAYSNIEEVDFSKNDTSKITNFSYCFNDAETLKKLSTIDCTSAELMNDFFGGWSGDFNDLTEVGGFLNIKCNMTNGVLDKVPNLTYESCMNVINGLYDFTGNGETPNSNQGQIKVHQNFINKLSEEELNIAINKGWSIQT